MNEAAFDDLDLTLSCLRQTLGVLMRHHCHQAHERRYADPACAYCQELRTAADQARSIHDRLGMIPVRTED